MEKDHIRVLNLTRVYEAPTKSVEQYTKFSRWVTRCIHSSVLLHVTFIMNPGVINTCIFKLSQNTKIKVAYHPSGKFVNGRKYGYSKLINLYLMIVI